MNEKLKNLLKKERNLGKKLKFKDATEVTKSNFNSSKKVTNKRTMAKRDVSVNMPDYKAENVFDDPQRFFKREMEEVKKTMFFK